MKRKQQTENNTPVGRAGCPDRPPVADPSQPSQKMEGGGGNIVCDEGKVGNSNHNCIDK